MFCLVQLLYNIYIAKWSTILVHFRILLQWHFLFMNNDFVCQEDATWCRHDGALLYLKCSCFTQGALVINSLLVYFDPQWCVLCVVWTVCLQATVFGFSGTRRLQWIVNILDRKQVTHIILNWKYVTTLSAISPSKGLILKSRDTTSTWIGYHPLYIMWSVMVYFTGVFYRSMLLWFVSYRLKCIIVGANE